MYDNEHLIWFIFFFVSDRSHYHWKSGKHINWKFSSFDSQVHYIEFDDENNVINKTVFMHKDGEIWHISSSPLDKDICATIYNKSEAFALTLIVF